MSDVATISTLTRYLVGDFVQTMVPGDIHTYTTSSVFSMSEPNIVTLSAVFLNDVELGSGDYSFDSSTKKVTITASLTSGDTLEFQYTYYPDFSDSEIESYIRSAIIYLSINNYYTFTLDEGDDNIYPEITDKERNLISTVTAILMRPGNESYRLPDIAINVPKALPTRDLISKTISIFKKNNTGIFTLA